MKGNNRYLGEFMTPPYTFLTSTANHQDFVGHSKYWLGAHPLTQDLLGCTPTYTFTRSINSSDAQPLTYTP